MQPGRPNNWNVVILGAWNQAILTPDWVSKNMFVTPEGTAVEVQVALDRVAPIRIKHGAVTVSPGPDRLVASCGTSDEPSLEEAANVLRRALSELPRTPVLAAGVNRRYMFDPIPAELGDLVRSTLSGRLEGEGREANAHNMKVRVPWAGGNLNLELTLDETKLAGAVSLNYELVSTDGPDLSAWLAKTRDMARDGVEIMAKILRVEISSGDEDDDG